MLIAQFESWSVALYPKRHIFTLFIAVGILVWPLAMVYPRENGELPGMILFFAYSSPSLIMGSIAFLWIIYWFDPNPVPYAMNTNIPKEDLLKKEIQVGAVLLFLFFAIGYPIRIGLVYLGIL